LPASGTAARVQIQHVVRQWRLSVSRALTARLESNGYVPRMHAYDFILILLFCNTADGADGMTFHRAR